MSGEIQIRRPRQRHKVPHTFSEVFHDVIVIVNVIILDEKTQSFELFVQRPFRQGGLSDVCAVEIVHAVGANHSLLLPDWCRLGGIEVEVSMYKRVRLERTSLVDGATDPYLMRSGSTF